MKKYRIQLHFVMILFPILLFMSPTIAQTTMHTVTLDPLENGTIKLDPALPADGKYSAGTEVTVTASPASGFAVDGVYYSIPGRFGAMYHEAASSPFKIKIDQDKHIGASFIEADKLKGFEVTRNVQFAKPGVKPLKYDVYAPEKANNLPAIIIIHGGGWSANDEGIMRGLARELVRDGKYVVFSIDYRWIGTLDGDEKPNSMANLIEDVYGAIAHIQEHAKEYGADPMRIAVTGDSAGGHLSAAVANMVDQIGDGGFGFVEGVYEYKPSYLPKNKSAEQVRVEIKNAIKAAAPSYGVFAGALLTGFMQGESEAALKAVSPISFIPNASERMVPQYLLRGTNDGLIQHEPVQAYADALTAAGQTVKYEQVEGASHAFFDWKPDAQTRATFEKYGVPYAAKMEAFFDEVFYKK